MSHIQGKKFYALREEGLSNAQIGELFGIKPHSVGGRVCEYRMAFNLPIPNPSAVVIKEEKKDKWDGVIRVTSDEEIREKAHKLMVLRNDGIFVCPARYAMGYGFKKSALE